MRRRRHAGAQHANYEATIHCATMNKLMALRTGLTPNATIDPKNLQTVLDLRAHFGPAAPGAPEKYLDLSNYNAVIDSRNA